MTKRRKMMNLSTARSLRPDELLVPCLPSVNPSRLHAETHSVRAAPFGAGHGRNMSGVSSALSSGQGMSGGSHVHSQSISSSHGTKSAGGISVLSQSTGNPESTDSELPGGRTRASLSQSSSPAVPARPLVGASIPMPPRHPHLQAKAAGVARPRPPATSLRRIYVVYVDHTDGAHRLPNCLASSPRREWQRYRRRPRGAVRGQWHELRW